MADSDDDVKSVDYFKKWTVKSLREFIRVRGYSTTGNKETLVALAFGLYSVNAPIQPTAIESAESKASDYLSRLTVDGTKLPDPLTELRDGWIGESVGMKKWPPTMYWDVCNFLGYATTGDLTKRLMSDYKDGKAYSYYTSGEQYWRMDFW